ncbi:hypothetical protein ACIQIG_29700 [Streptomyces bacillaris]|uniref:hypothetical protein n=1 Tax=Streptomyces TaxID=1883 RepID=UPI001152CCE3|nr:MULTISPECIES: hypothetical protein [Streptomyces]NUV81044.1 hypothetical protein [Streptomyces sp. CAI-155]
MPIRRRTSRRTLMLVRAVLCVAGLVATAWLNADPASEARPKKPVRAECREHIADIERKFDEARRDSKNGGSILASSRDAAGADCDDELQALLDGER